MPGSPGRGSCKQLRCKEIVCQQWGEGPSQVFRDFFLGNMMTKGFFSLPGVRFSCCQRDKTCEVFLPYMRDLTCHTNSEGVTKA